MKTLLLTKDGRTIVQKLEAKPSPKIRNRKKDQTIVYCPNCGSEIPYSEICKQFNYKIKYNREMLQIIITEQKQLSTGELAKQYQAHTGNPISIRQLNNILKDFCKKSFIKTRIVNSGRYGRTKIISLFSVNANYKKSRLLEVKEKEGGQ